MVREQLKEVGQEWLALAKWSLVASVIGGTVGLTICGFHWVVAGVTAYRQAHGWALWLLPAAGACIALLYRACGFQEDRGANWMLQSVRSEEVPALRVAPLIFLASALTQLVGGSSGRTGASLQMGGSIAAAVGGLFHPTAKERHVMVTCGLAAAFSALFGAPMAAAFFAMEVISVGEMVYSALVPCVVAALTAWGTLSLFHLPATRFTLVGLPGWGIGPFLRVILLAALCGLVSILFCEVVHAAGRLYKRYIPHAVLRAAVGGLLVLILTLVVGSDRYNGPGGGLVALALTGGAVVPWDFLMKLLFTAVTIGAGFKGGEVFPSFCVGAAFGCVTAPLLGLSPSFGAAVGLVSLFCGVTNCPVSSLLLALEFFGGEGTLFFLAAVGVSYMASGYTGLFSAQKILYSKSRPEFIDIHAQ